MRPIQELLNLLDSAAETTFRAQLEYVEACAAELDAKTILDDFTAELKAEASANKDLKNAEMRAAYISEAFGDDPGASYRKDHAEAIRNKGKALAIYDFHRRFGADVRTMVNALSAGRE